MDLTTQVAQLNKKIEQISREKVKAETQLEMLLKNLTVELNKYKSEFGVDLGLNSLNNLDLLNSQVSAELSKVQTEVQQEYDFKSKIVSLVESGSYVEAKALLEGSNGTKVEEQSTDLNGSESFTPEENIQDNIQGTTSEEDFDFGLESMGTSVAQEQIISNSVVAKDIKSAMGIVPEVSPKRVVTSTQTYSPVNDSLQTQPKEDTAPINMGNFNIPNVPTGQGTPTEEPKNYSFNLGSMNLKVADEEESTDPIEDDEDFDFGFGNILNGGKF